jgi:hypothetical protein
VSTIAPAPTFLERNTDTELRFMLAKVVGYLLHPAGYTKEQIEDCLQFHVALRQELTRRGL